METAEFEVNVDYLDSQYWGPEMPARLQWLRENDPVYWAEASRCWIITRYPDVLEISKDQDLFTSALGVRAHSPVKFGLIDEAEPRHGRLRRLMNRGFTPRMVKIWEDKFLQLCTETLDEVASRGACDFVEDIAVPLPLGLIAEMIGIRREDRDRFHRWSDDMMAGDGNFDRPEIVAKAAQAYIEYGQYVTEILEDRRKNPRDDLSSALVAAKDAGMLRTFDEDRENFNDADDDALELANDELIKLMVVLLVAGNETTRNAISGGMELLIEHPEARQRLVEDPSKIPAAVEEMLRMVSPVNTFSRTVTVNTEFRGKRFGEGDKVLLVYPSANRDAEVFENPDVFDIDRNPQHLAFGIGSHFCLGANLARMEMRLGFAEILRRLPDMEYADGGPQMRPSALVRSMMHMPVRFTPEG